MKKMNLGSPVSSPSAAAMANTGAPTGLSDGTGAAGTPCTCPVCGQPTTTDAVQGKELTVSLEPDGTLCLSPESAGDEAAEAGPAGLGATGGPSDDIGAAM